MPKTGSGGIEKSHSCKWAKWIQWHALPHIQQSTQQRNKGYYPNLHGWDFSIPPSPKKSKIRGCVHRNLNLKNRRFCVVFNNDSDLKIFKYRRVCIQCNNAKRFRSFWNIHTFYSNILVLLGLKNEKEVSIAQVKWTLHVQSSMQTILKPSRYK